MEEIEKFYQERKAKIISIVALVLMLITVRYMLDLVLLTFIITFISYHLVRKIQGRYRKTVKVRIPDGLILTLIYLLFIAVVLALSGSSLPRLSEQIMWIADMFKTFDIEKVKEAVDPRLAAAMSYIDFNKYISEIGVMLAGAMTAIGTFALNFFIAMILSFMLLLEKQHIRNLGENLANSKVAYIYGYFITFGGNFCKTFGKVMKVQVTIAFINCILSMIGLKIIGFESVIGLGMMIFCLGMIPVAGVVISLLPLAIIAFSLGGVIKVLQVLIMVAVIHAVEAYILNPKLMSNKTRLPVCFVFIILLVGEHYLGVWGLLIGVPIFIFAMNLLEVDYEVPKHDKKGRKNAGKNGSAETE